jgi:hypothetical protein
LPFILITQMNFQNMEFFGDIAALEAETTTPSDPPPPPQICVQLPVDYMDSSNLQRASSNPFEFDDNFGTLDEMMEFVSTEPPPNPSIEPPIQWSGMHHGNGNLGEDLMYIPKGLWLPEGGDTIRSQMVMPAFEQAITRKQTPQNPTRKRRPKAQTISAKTWAPHEDRFRQLYINEGKSIGDLREIMNRELGITAT